MKLTQDNMIILGLAGVALYFLTQTKKTNASPFLKTNSNGLANTNNSIADYFDMYKPVINPALVNTVDLEKPTSRVTDV